MAKVIIIKEIKAKAGTLGRGMASGITEGRMAVREILEDTTKVAKATLVEKTKVAKVNGLIMGKGDFGGHDKGGKGDFGGKDKGGKGGWQDYGKGDGKKGATNSDEFENW